MGRLLLIILFDCKGTDYQLIIQRGFYRVLTFYLHVTYIKYESVKSIIIIIKNMIISYTFEQILFS